ncbi:MAG: hypothetical protein IPK64_14165 [bacterium]|nr:hypothetical protein [bacterium]
MSRTGPPASLPGRLHDGWSLALVFAVYLASNLLMPARGLWMVDNENRFLQVQALADAGFTRYAIPWKGAELDPGFAMNPLRFDPEGTFEGYKNGQLIAVFQPTYLYLSALALKAGGPVGLNLLPILGAMAMLVAVSALARRLDLGARDRHLAVIVAGLATPAWFYSLNLWEHTLAAACCAWGLVGLVQFLRERTWRPLLLGFAGLGAAVFLRDVLGLFALVVTVLLAARLPSERRRVVVAAGAVLGGSVALLVLFQWLTTGHPLGFHADTLARGAGAGAGGHLAKRPLIFLLYFVGAHPERAVSFLLAAPFLAAFVLRPRLQAARAPLLVPGLAALAALAGAGFLAGFLASPTPLNHLLSANGFFVAAPVVILGLLRPAAAATPKPSTTARELILQAACLYFVAYCLVAPWAGAVSLHWGGRLQFSLYPLLAVLAVAAMADWRDRPGRRPAVAWAGLAAVLLVSIAGQAYSVTLVRHKKLHAERLAMAMEQLEPQVVITDVWWAGHELYASFRDRTIFYVRSQAQLEALAGQLVARGVDRFVFATRPRPGPAAPGAIRVDDGGWGFYSLDLLVSPLGAPRAPD